MNLNKEELNQLKRIAEEAAVEAGKVISEKSGSFGEVANKETGSSETSQVVTEVDLLSQNIILEKLNPTLKEFELGLLTEESADDNSRHVKEFFWSVDPLDGTLAFIKGEPGYSVSIALVSKDGISQIGVVYDPTRKLLYSAVIGEGVFKNGKRWKPEKVNKEFTVAYDRSFKKSRYYESSLNSIKKLAETYGCKSINIVDNCGAVLNAINVLENCPGCYFKFPKKEEGGGSLWDFSATACIFREAGLFVSDIYGHNLNLNLKSTTFMNKYGVIFTDNIEIGNYITEFYSSYISS